VRLLAQTTATGEAVCCPSTGIGTRKLIVASLAALAAIVCFGLLMASEVISWEKRAMKLTRRNLLAFPVAAWATNLVSADRQGNGQESRPGSRQKWQPKLSENLGDLEPSTLRWFKQLGCKHVIFQGSERVDRVGKGFWTVTDVSRLKRRCEQAGLVLHSMMIPIGFYHKAMMGKPGRDEQIDNVCRSIKAAGQCGVPMLEWRWIVDFLWDERVGDTWGERTRTGTSARRSPRRIVFECPRLARPVRL